MSMEQPPKMIYIPTKEIMRKFIKICFKQPRRTFKNNMMQTHIDLAKIPEKYLLLRSQQMKMADFLHIWELVRS